MLIVFFKREDVDRRYFCRRIIGVSGIPHGPYCVCKTNMAAYQLRIKCCVLFFLRWKLSQPVNRIPVSRLVNPWCEF